ncbi:MAG: Glu-tRNA(Gln) amidotransferase subunit GatD [Candidatus Nanoarchaeia archaeon]|jgi:glutamyl-tRNA(Gln) amidotransferase subunit D
MDYSGKLKIMLKSVSVGDLVEVSCRGQVFKGSLMPRAEAGDGILVLKLSNGYNIGLKPDLVKKLKSVPAKKSVITKITPDSSKKNIVILGAGGTIASKVDYRTGGVKPAMTPEEITQFTPGLNDLANIKARVLFQMLSENMTPKQWSLIAAEVKKEVDAGADGVVIMHGTDIMGYTSAYLSFALQDLSVPVVLVGAQRSADRASCDSHINLLCAVKAATSDIAEVMVCMHEGLSDDSCVLHQGNRVRKMHSSRRDAFRSIGVLPYARVNYPSLDVELLRDDFSRRDQSKRIKLLNGFDDRVALVKFFPGMKSELISSLKCRGLVIEGTGLGHIPMKSYGDAWTAKNLKVFKAIKDFKGIIFMTSQTIDGRVNMNVYETGRDLLSLGVLGNLQNLLPETAYVKMVWALGNSKTLKEAKELMSTNINGELTERSEII